jgi:hypothetical protein
MAMLSPMAQSRQVLILKAVMRRKWAAQFLGRRLETVRGDRESAEKMPIDLHLPKCPVATKEEG